MYYIVVLHYLQAHMKIFSNFLCKRKWRFFRTPFKTRAAYKRRMAYISFAISNSDSPGAS